MNKLCNKLLKIAFVLVCMCSVHFVVHAHSSQRLPRFVDTHLADYYLLESPIGKAYSKQTGYHLYIQHEFDGVSNTIFIAPSPRLFGYDNYSAPSLAFKSSQLRTGRGIKIGDSTKELWAKLGRSHSVEYKILDNKKLRVDTYTHWNKKTGSARREYDAEYLSFKHRIYAIKFSYYRGEW